MVNRRDPQSEEKEVQTVQTVQAVQAAVEIDIRKILEQMGIPEDKWPDEWARKKTV
jgi:hypothetical protein